MGLHRHHGLRHRSGLEDEGVPVRIIDIQKNHHSDVMTELADCGAVIVGSATHNNNVLPGIATC